MARKRAKTSAPAEVFSSGIRWWRAEDSELADALNTQFSSVQRSQAGRQSQDIQYLRMYNGQRGLPGQVSAIRTMSGEEIQLNVVANIVRALRAKVTKNRPKPWILTEAGSQKQQDRAQGLQHFVEGVFYESKAYELAERVFDDAAICGEGWVIAFVDEHGTLRIEREFPWAVHIDDQDGFYDSPRSMYRAHDLDRDHLAEMFPDSREAIQKTAESKGHSAFGLASRNVDQIRVVEAWHLPSGPDAGDGRHVIATQDTVLLDEPWTRSSFPWVRFRIEPDPIGSHGTGVVEELWGLQCEINEIALKLSDAHQLGGNVILAIEAGSKVNKSKVTNKVLAQIEYTGTPPTPIAVPAVAPEVYQYLEGLILKAYETYGVSQLTAQSTLPAGLQQASGKALRTYHDIESERFSYVIRAYERFFCDLAQAVIDAAGDAAEQEGGSKFSVRYRGVDSIKRIRWSDVRMDSQDYAIAIYPIAFLSQTPPAKQADIMDALKMGLITPQEARAQMQFPDPESALDPYGASRRLTRLQIDRMLREGQGAIAESFQDLSLALQLALAAYCDAQAKSDIPPENLELLREYIDDLIERTKPAAPAPAAPIPA